jgi:hypothetical protein
MVFMGILVIRAMSGNGTEMLETIKDELVNFRVEMVLLIGSSCAGKQWG